MKTLLALCTLFICLPARPKTPDLDHERLGSWLYHVCLAETKVSDQPKNTLPKSDLEQSERCLDYIAGYIEGTILSNRFCIPETSSTGTVVRLYVAYMQKEPKFMDMSRNIGLERAMVTNYPCPSQTKDSVVETIHEEAPDLEEPTEKK